MDLRRLNSRSVGRLSLAPHRRSSGFTLIELMIVLGIIGVMGAMAALMMPSTVRGVQADSGTARVAAALRTAREQAVSQRRNVRISFTNPNQIVVERENGTGTGTVTYSPIATAVLEDGVKFAVFSETPDTPDAFGHASALAFGTATSRKFTSEGTFVDQNGDPLNGTIYLGRAQDGVASARAVTIFGPTALIRQWRWDGAHWTN
jgi:type II secretion system protein H